MLRGAPWALWSLHIQRVESEGHLFFAMTKIGFTQVNFFDVMDTLLLADGLDDALVGLAPRGGTTSQPVAVYDLRRVLVVLVEQHDMSYEQALEYAEFNILGAWGGEETPIFMTTLDSYEKEELLKGRSEDGFGGEVEEAAAAIQDEEPEPEPDGDA